MHGQIPVLKYGFLHTMAQCLTVWTSYSAVRSSGEFSRNLPVKATLKNDDGIYRKLISSGDEKNAIKIADKKYKNWIRQCEDIEVIPPSKVNACTMMFEIVGEIRSKTVQALE